MKRRHFLQFSGSLLASLGLSQLDLIHQANRYAKVLAQSTSRKLALLVGINEYQPELGQLQGCTTDIEMQRELLIHRFGFNPSDILEVKNAQATRQGILTAFDEHLIKQAKPGDVVVFHYSGHGARVVDPNPIGDKEFNSTIVPVERPPESVTQPNIAVPDIMGQTLFLLMSAVPTEYLTVVLDSCHSGGGKRGNLIVRSANARLASEIKLQPSPEEIEYQKQLLSKLNLEEDQFHKLRQQGVAKGVVIASAKDEQFAADAPFSGFHAGAFSYLLTRYLWQETGNPSLETVFANLALRTKDLAESANIIQDPEFEVKPENNHESQPLFFLEKTRPAAEAVIRKVEGKRVTIWLGGIASQSLEAYDGEAIFSIIDDEGQEQGQIQQESRVGLEAYGTVLQVNQPELVKPGTLLRELVRGIPTDLPLRLGVDDTLGDEKTQVQAALQGQKRIKPVAVDQQSSVDYLLGRVTQEDFRSWQTQGVSNLYPVGSIGLFTAGREPIPESFGRVGESAQEAVKRLQPRLKTLLAGRILRTLHNGDASPLNVAISIKAMDNSGAASTAKSRGTQNAQPTRPPDVNTLGKIQFPPGTDVQIQVQNNERRSLYFSVLVIDSAGGITILFPLDWDAPEEKALVAPGETLTLPTEDGVYITVQEDAGTFEVLVIASVESLRNALKGLQSIAQSRGIRRGALDTLNEDEPVNVMENLLGDLDNHARAAGFRIRGGQAVDTKQLAVISTVVETIAS
ncbi:MAG: caspase family protein [Coleofasciculus sp. S288]|nr:caspase family protein [Coleofasciculus sp. S288]